jgi:CubicO group peptidase (beta-lactamase class C family)
MYIVMSYVLETLKGQWLGDLLYEHIWHPLGMESTVSCSPFKKPAVFH